MGVYEALLSSPKGKIIGGSKLLSQHKVLTGIL